MENSLMPQNNNTSTTEAWYKDNRKIVKFIIAAVAIVTIGNFALPYLNTFLSGLIDGTLNGMKLLWSGAGLIVSFLFLTSKKTWRIVDYALAIISKMLTFWIIDWDEFIIQEKEIEQAENDAEKVNTHADSLEGEYNRVSNEINRKVKERDQAEKEAKLAESEGKDNLATLRYNDYVRAKDFITELEPMAKDLKFLVEFCRKAYDESQYKIRDARNTLQTEKIKYETISRSASALKSAQKALFGDLSLSKDAQLAREQMKMKISQKIGTIKGAIRATSKLMEESDLRDRAKILQAKEEIKKIDSGYVDVSTLKAPSTFSTEAEKLKNLLN